MRLYKDQDRQEGDEYFVSFYEAEEFLLRLAQRCVYCNVEPGEPCRPMRSPNGPHFGVPYEAGWFHSGGRRQMERL